MIEIIITILVIGTTAGSGFVAIWQGRKLTKLDDGEGEIGSEVARRRFEPMED